jgi:hypothetical protein
MDKTIDSVKSFILGFCITIIVIILLCILARGYEYTMNIISTNIIDSHGIINIIMNVGLISGFLGVFFFTYAAGVEQEIVQKNTKIITDDLMQGIAPALNVKTKQNLLINLKAPDLSQADADTLASNTKLTKDALAQLFLILDIGLTLSFIISILYKHSFISALGLNLIIMLFVGLTEFTFINFIPYRFIAADTNFVRYTILTKLKTKLIFDPKPPSPSVSL